MIDYEYYRARRWHKRRDTRRAFVLLPLAWLALVGLAVAFFRWLSA